MEEEIKKEGEGKKPLPKQLYTKVDFNWDTEETIPADYPGIRGIMSAIDADGYMSYQDYVNAGICCNKEDYDDKDGAWHQIYYFCFTEPLWIIYNFPEIWEHCTEERPTEDAEKYPEPGNFGCHDLGGDDEEEEDE